MKSAAIYLRSYNSFIFTIFKLFLEFYILTMSIKLPQNFHHTPVPFNLLFLKSFLD